MSGCFVFPFSSLRLLVLWLQGLTVVDLFCVEDLEDLRDMGYLYDHYARFYYALTLCFA